MKQYSTGDAQGTQDSVAEGEKTGEFCRLLASNW